MKQNIKLVFVIALSCVLTLGVVGTQKTSATVPGINSIISTDSSGNQTSSTRVTDVSSDGRYVVMQSSATSMVSGDTNAKDDIFVKDKTSGTITRASVSTTGTESNDSSSNAKISYDGRYIVFQSAATNLTNDGGGGTASGGGPAYHIYRHDMQTGATELVSKSITNSASNDAAKTDADISADGRFIVFSSSDRYLLNLSTGPGLPGTQIFVRDMALSTTKLVSLGGGTASSAVGTNSHPSVSCDGAVIVFDSNARDLVSPNDTDSFRDIFINNRAGGDYITKATQGGNGQSTFPSISCDGNYVTYLSNANNIVGDTSSLTPNSSASTAAYLYSNVDKTNRSVSRNSSSQTTPIGDYSSNPYASLAAPSISGDGRYVLFASLNGTASYSQVYISDIKNNTIQIISRSSAGTAGNWYSDDVHLTDNGKYSVYAGQASNLVTTDTNGNGKDSFLSETGF